jgi:hypothetical protein
MNTNKEDAPMFASENTIFRIVLISKIVSWIILVFYLISFVSSDLLPLIQGQSHWPTQFSQWPMAVASLFFAPAIGLFYFLVLQAVAQGLNLGLDIYYDFQSEEDEEEEVVVEA